jgi:hypothetical protein
MDANQLLRPGGPWLQVFVGSPSEATDLAMALNHKERGRPAARWLRGVKMTTTAKLFDEMAAALQFPYYFGENWDALDECLADLDWLQADAYVIVILDAIRVMDADGAEARQTFWKVIQGVAHAWHQPGNTHPPRDPKIFRVVVQCSAA